MGDWMIVPSDSDLLHHGRLGQKWGQRNGPPYPLGMSARTYKAVQKTGKVISTVAKGTGKAVSKTAKALKKHHDETKIKNQKKKEVKEQKKTEKMKRKAVSNNSYQELYDMKDRLTYKELDDAKNRIKLEQEIYRLANPPKKGLSYYTDKLSTAVSKFNSYYSTGKNTWNNIAELYNSTESGKKNPMITIGKGSGGKKDKSNNNEQNSQNNQNNNNSGGKNKGNGQPTIVYNNINPTFYQQSMAKPKKEKKDKKKKNSK